MRAEEAASDEVELPKSPTKKDAPLARGSCDVLRLFRERLMQLADEHEVVLKRCEELERRCAGEDASESRPHPRHLSKNTTEERLPEVRSRFHEITTQGQPKGLLVQRSLYAVCPDDEHSEDVTVPPAKATHALDFFADVELQKTSSSTVTDSPEHGQEVALLTNSGHGQSVDFAGSPVRMTKATTRKSEGNHALHSAPRNQQNFFPPEVKAVQADQEIPEGVSWQSEDSLNSSSDAPDFVRLVSVGTAVSAVSVEPTDDLAMAWDECYFNAREFSKSFIFEILPTVCGGPLCWMLEGIQSAKNRSLMYSWASWKHPFNNPMVIDLCWLAGPWTVLAMWFYFQPDEMPSSLVYFPLLLLLWRASVISMKYAYMRRTDLEMLRGSPVWRNSLLNFRSLGNAAHFDTVGTWRFDMMDQLYMSALRANLLETLRASTVYVGHSKAAKIWRKVQAALVESNDIDAVRGRALFSPPGAHIRTNSLSVDVQEALGLADLEGIGEMSSQRGELPTVVLAYFLVLRAYAPLQKKVFGIIAILGLFAGTLEPIVRSSCRGVNVGEFGASPAITALFVSRAWVVSMASFPSALFMAYPVLDAAKRYWLSLTVLRMYGDTQMRRWAPTVVVKLKLDTASDVQIFWIICRLLGPDLNAGLSTRYSSAYVLVMAIFAVVGLVLMNFEVHFLGRKMPVSLIVELVTFSSCCAVSVVASATIQVAVNNHLKRLQALLWRSELERQFVNDDTAHCRDLTRAASEDLLLQHGELRPNRIGFLPATPRVLLLVRSLLTMFLVGVLNAIRGNFDLLA